MPEIGKSLTDIDPLAAKIKTGTYTGDGTTSQAITGVGFKPKYVIIWTHETAEVDLLSFESVDQFDATYSTCYHISAAFSQRMRRIVSLDADGFTVDDDDADLDPNKLNETYDYLALG